jgi:hypothetical protein
MRSPDTYLVSVEAVRLVGALLGVEQKLHNHSQHVAPREAFLRLNRVHCNGNLAPKPKLRSSGTIVANPLKAKNEVYSFTDTIPF